MKPKCINLYPSSQLKLWGCFVISMDSLTMLERSASTDNEYDFCPIEFVAVFCLCGVLGYTRFLVLHSDASDVFRNNGGCGAVHLDDMCFTHVGCPG
jgi:hypothetical protein